MSRWFPEPLTLGIGHGVGSSTNEAMIVSMNDRLDDLRPVAGTRLTCVVGGAVVRYRVIPWSDELAAPAQRRTLAAHVFQEAYGETTRSWVMREHAAAPGHSTLASAVDSHLLEAIGTVCRQRRLRLASVQPSLMYAFNRHRAHLDGVLSWFIWIEELWVTALLRSQRQTLHVRQLASWRFDVERWLDREWFALALDLPPCPVYVARAAASIDTHAALEQRRVEFPEPQRHRWTVIELPALTVGVGSLAGATAP